jgi:hypothetical protein
MRESHRLPTSFADEDSWVGDFWVQNQILDIDTSRVCTLLLLVSALFSYLVVQGQCGYSIRNLWWPLFFGKCSLKFSTANNKKTTTPYIFVYACVTRPELGTVHVYRVRADKSAPLFFCAPG